MNKKFNSEIFNKFSKININFKHKQYIILSLIVLIILGFSIGIGVGIARSAKGNKLVIVDGKISKDQFTVDYATQLAKVVYSRSLVPDKFPDLPSDLNTFSLNNFYGSPLEFKININNIVYSAVNSIPDFKNNVYTYYIDAAYTLPVEDNHTDPQYITGLGDYNSIYGCTILHEILKINSDFSWAIAKSWADNLPQSDSNYSNCSTDLDANVDPNHISDSDPFQYVYSKAYDTMLPYKRITSIFGSTDDTLFKDDNGHPDQIYYVTYTPKPKNSSDQPKFTTSSDKIGFTIINPDTSNPNIPVAIQDIQWIDRNQVYMNATGIAINTYDRNGDFTSDKDNKFWLYIKCSSNFLTYYISTSSTIDVNDQDSMNKLDQLAYSGPDTTPHYSKGASVPHGSIYVNYSEIPGPSTLDNDNKTYKF